MRENVCDQVRQDINATNVSSLTKKFAISEEDLKFTHRIFEKFDSDCDGKLSKWELIEAFIYLGLIAFTSGDIQVCYSGFCVKTANHRTAWLLKIDA